MSIFFSMLGILIFLVIGGAVLQGGDFILFQFFAPKYEQVRRETFEQSKAYRQGMVQELENMRFQYIQADDEHKAALLFIIRHRASDVPRALLSPELRELLTTSN